MMPAAATSPQTTRVSGRDRTMSDTYRLGRVLLFVMVCVALDTKDFFDKGGKARYLLPMIPVMAAISIFLRRRGEVVRRPRAPDKILFLLMVLGLAGSLWGTVFRGTQSTTLPVFLPMMVAFTYLLTLERPSEQEVLKLLRGLALVGLVYVFMNATANSGVLSSVFAAKVYRNSKAFFILLGIAAAILSRRRLVLSLMILLAVFVFITYPSGTDVVVALVTLMTFWMTKPRSSRLRPYVIVALGLSILILALVNLNSTTSIANSYFGSVGKRNNTTTRLALWQAGIDLFKQSPVYGSGFSGEITILVYRQSDFRAPFKAPFHDDYVMLLAAGGLIGFGLVAWWVAATEVEVLRRYRGFLASGRYQSANLLRALLVAFNVFFVAALFNPELSGAGRGTTLFAMYAMMMMLGRPDRPQGRARRPSVAANRSSAHP
jgi:O-antigen ligase